MEGSCGLVLCCGINMCDIDSIRYYIYRYVVWYRYLSMFHYLTCDDIFLNLTSPLVEKLKWKRALEYVTSTS